MERLTTRNSEGIAVFKQSYQCDRCGESFWRLPDLGSGSPTDRLAEYEDLEEQCIKENACRLRMLLKKWQEFFEDIHELYQYREMEKQGKMLKLPCAVGDTVYRIQKCLAPNCKACKAFNHLNNCYTKYKARIFETEFDMQYFYKFGKTVFLTKDEAEAALKELVN